MEDQNEMMETENVEVEETENASGLSSGVAMLFGASATLVALVAGWGVKTLLAKRKTKKEHSEENPADSDPIEEEDFETVDDE